MAANNKQLIEEMFAWWMPGREIFDDDAKRVWLEKAVDICKDHAPDIKDLAQWTMVLSIGHDDINPGLPLLLTYSAQAKLKAQDKNGVLVLQTALDSINEPGWLSKMSAKTGLEGKKLDRPLYLALTGRMDGPDLYKIVSLLTKTQLTDRLQAGLDWLNKSGEYKC